MVRDIRTAATSPNCVMRTLALSGFTFSEAVSVTLVSGSSSTAFSVADSVAGSVAGGASRSSLAFSSYSETALLASATASLAAESVAGSVVLAEASVTGSTRRMALVQAIKSAAAKVILESICNVFSLKVIIA